MLVHRDGLERMDVQSTAMMQVTGLPWIVYRDCRTMRQAGRSMPDPPDARVTMADPDLWTETAGGWPSKKIPAHGVE